ncbi:hypothetical protein IDJ75_11220 [Mucilaginibacter rigui]|uniref:Toprim domain-containing protein n=1 Tax=Mucilaginibacter rigui TaxID=534635 RepID=A0ABR7X5K1_9SPHI|nr:hypothetical protein [Mucilaginibacter rigui]MBD1385851.1 hypothetical protein [Mucilaginibacter rigui]
MDSHLSKLGVPPELQAYFGTADLCFDFGDEQELFGEGFHRVPTTPDLWMAGSYPATELIITSSAMEAVAYMTLNAWRHPPNAVMSFIAIGNLPHPRQIQWISAYCQKRKITLVFSNDLPGKLTDIIVASGIRKKAVRAAWQRGKVHLHLGQLALGFLPEVVSLNAFEKAAGIRTGIRTRKPAGHNTFLDQLIYDQQQ